MVGARLSFVLTIPTCPYHTQVRKGCSMSLSVPSKTPKTRTPALPLSLRPLADKNFGVFWTGAFLSSVGFWIQNVGQGWQVLQLTNSALLLGLVSFAATLPNIIFSLLGGVVADRL